MYMRLLYYANLARYKTAGGEWVFRKWVTVASKNLIQDMGVSRPTLYRIRDELVADGYIRFKAGIGAGTTEYMLCLLASGKKDPPKAEGNAPAQSRNGATFETDDFFRAAVIASMGEEFDPFK